MAISLGPNGLQLNDGTHNDYADFAGGGKVLQVLTNNFSGTINSNSYMNISSNSVTITPSSTSSKILVIAHSWGTQSNQASNGSMRLLRGATEIKSATCYAGQHGVRNLMPFTINYLDSPSTTSATTYKLQWKRNTSGGLGTTDYAATGSIQVLEIGS